MSEYDIARLPSRWQTLVQQYYDGKQAWRDQWRGRPFERGSNSGLRGDSYSECSEPAQVNGTKQGEQYEYSGGQQGFGNRGQRYHGNVKPEPGIDREERHSGGGVPTCFKCGKRGHMKFDCPSRIGRVTSLGGTGSPKVLVIQSVK